MNIRAITADDAEHCGRVIYEAFQSIDDLRNLPRDFPNAESARQMAGMAINDPAIYGVAAVSDDGEFLGSNFLWEHDAIRGVGPITIDPQVQSKGVGRRLMEAVIERGKDAPGIRLVQGAYNLVSMSLYTRLGFDVVEPLVIVEGTPNGAEETTGAEIRPLEENDLEECNELCRRTHGFDRANELRQISRMFPAFVAVRSGRITGYASAPVMWQLNHAVAETTEDMRALLAGAARLSGRPLSFLLPTRQAELFRWSLKNGLRVLKPLTLMVMGEYREPESPYLPSVLY